MRDGRVATHRVEVVRFDGGSGRLLDGVLWRRSPTVAKDCPVVVHLHGKGGNFYTGPGRFIPELTWENGLAHFSVNLSCHDLGYTRDDQGSAPRDSAEAVGGGMWEHFEDGVTETQACVEMVRSLGYERVFLAGHSSGGAYALRAVARGAKTSGLALLSPLVSSRSVLDRWFPGGRGLSEAVERAEELVGQGRGHWLLPAPQWFYAISAASLLERMASREGDFSGWLEAVRGIPLLMIWAAGEDRAPLWQRLYEMAEIPEKRAVVVDGQDHWYGGQEAVVAGAVETFVRSSAAAGTSRG